MGTKEPKRDPVIRKRTRRPNKCTRGPQKRTQVPNRITGDPKRVTQGPKTGTRGSKKGTQVPNKVPVDPKRGPGITKWEPGNQKGTRGSKQWPRAECAIRETGASTPTQDTGQWVRLHYFHSPRDCENWLVDIRDVFVFFYGLHSQLT